MANWKDIIGPLKNTETFKHAYAFQKARREQGVTVFPPQRISLMLCLYSF